VIRPQLDEVKAFSSGTAVVWSGQAHKLGLIDRVGKLILPYEYTSIEPFHGLSFIKEIAKPVSSTRRAA
jgi:hypothetical protein